VRHVELFTTPDDVKILAQPRGQMLSNPERETTADLLAGILAWGRMRIVKKQFNHRFSFPARSTLHPLIASVCP
jgi:hypothetical protein